MDETHGSIGENFENNIDGMNPRGKFGVIDVGGGMRGIYAAGVFDRCLDDGVDFDVAIGISAGSANTASYISKQRGRNIAFYNDYAFRDEYMSLGNLLKKGSFIDLDYVYSELSNEGGEKPLDYDALEASPIDWRILAENAETGETVVFTKEDISRNDYDILKASSAIPTVNRPYVIDGVPYYDGALGDTVPLEMAFGLGCTKVVLIATKPIDEPRSAAKDLLLALGIRFQYPESSTRLACRAERYNYGIELAKALQEDGLVLIVAPDDLEGMSTLKRDRESMMRLYQKGYDDAAKIKPFLEG